jgi:hypothetical protein
MNTEASILAPSPPIDPVAVAQPVAPPAGGDDKLEQILPQLRQLAQTVGGFDKLMDIIKQLDNKDA